MWKDNVDDPSIHTGDTVRTRLQLSPPPLGALLSTDAKSHPNYDDYDYDVVWVTFESLDDG